MHSHVAMHALPFFVFHLSFPNQKPGLGLHRLGCGETHLLVRDLLAQERARGGRRRECGRPGPVHRGRFQRPRHCQERHSRICIRCMTHDYRVNRDLNRVAMASLPKAGERFIGLRAVFKRKGRPGRRVPTKCQFLSPFWVRSGAMHGARGAALAQSLRCSAARPWAAATAGQ